MPALISHMKLLQERPEAQGVEVDARKVAAVILETPAKPAGWLTRQHGPGPCLRHCSEEIVMYFEKSGVVSVWVGQVLAEPKKDFLRNQFNAEDYDLDFQDCIVEKGKTPLRDLASRLSYAESFIDPLLQRARDAGLTEALWMLAQYDYAYDLSKANLREVPAEPLFLGAFEWHE
jgi:hypothetical protein